jgi:hypothetical protein
MRLELATEDARFVHTQLARRVRDLEQELNHTEKRDLRNALAVDLTRLQNITHDLERRVADDLKAADDFV